MSTAKVKRATNETKPLSIAETGRNFGFTRKGVLIDMGLTPGNGNRSRSPYRKLSGCGVLFALLFANENVLCK